MVLKSLDVYIKRYLVNRFEKKKKQVKVNISANKRCVIFMLCLTFWSTPAQSHVLAFVN